MLMMHILSNCFQTTDKNVFRILNSLMNVCFSNGVPLATAYCIDST